MNTLTDPTTSLQPFDVDGVAETTGVSVLILVAGRPQPLAELYEELATAMRAADDPFEFVFVVEPAFVPMTAPLLELAARGEPIRLITLGQPLDQTSLLRVGVRHCRGSIIVTVPARRRVEAAALGQLVAAIKGGADLAIARRWPRRDRWIDGLRARVLHLLVARAVKTSAEALGDVTSGVRAMRRDLLDRIPVHGPLGRFLPLVALRDGYAVTEVPVAQHEADRRRRFYSPFTYGRFIVDLVAFFFLLRFTERPLRFFGLAGTAAVAPGLAILALLFVERLAGQAIAGRPLLLFGVLLVVLGIQMVALGLIGEIIVHLHATTGPSYRIKAEPATTKAEAIVEPGRTH